MKIKLNFKCGEVTENGNVYTKEAVKNGFDKALEKNNIPVSFGSDKNPNNMVGLINDQEIKENGEITVSAEPTKDILKSLNDPDLRSKHNVGPSFQVESDDPSKIKKILSVSVYPDYKDYRSDINETITD